MTEDKLPDHSRDYNEVADLINSRADIRLAAMIGVGYLERYVEDLIRRRLESVPGPAVDLLFKKHLRQISSRLAFAEALEIIESSVKKDLQTLCDIRNRFAHHIVARDATDPTVKSLIGKLKVLNGVMEDSPRESDPLDENDQLRLMISATVSSLHSLIEDPYC